MDESGQAEIGYCPFLLQQIEDLSRSFEDFHLSFSSRTRKKVAHVIAHTVSRDNQAAEWLTTPPGLEDIINAEY